MTATTGVYFRSEDYAGFWRRLLVDVVDFVVFGAFCIGLATVMASILPQDEDRMYLISLGCTVAGNLYFVLLKRSRFRTLGYRAGKVKIVGLDGQVPTYTTLSLRSAFGLFGPLNWLDSIWLFNDTHGQTLRDKFTGTYVVKEDAQPAGQGRIVFRLYEIAFYNCIFREVDAMVAASQQIGMAQTAL